MIPQPIRLAFDPATEDAETKAIFSSRVARTLWMGWKVKHLSNQHFNQEVLSAANRIEANPPETVKDLKALICHDYPDFVRGQMAEHEWLEEILPYIKGEKELIWEIRK